MPTCTPATPCSQYVEDMAHARNAALYGMTNRLFRCVLGGHSYWTEPVAAVLRPGAPVMPGGPRRVKTGASSRRRLTLEERDLSLDRRHAAKDRAMAGLGKR